MKWHEIQYQNKGPNLPHEDQVRRVIMKLLQISDFLVNIPIRIR